MPWLEQRPNGCFHVAFRFNGQKLKKSLRTSDAQTAEVRLHQLEENIRLLEKGRLEIPEDTDVVAYLLSNGRLDGRPRVSMRLRTLRQFADSFLASIPDGSLEVSTVKGMRIHLDHLYRGFGRSFLLPTLSLEDLQAYVDRRSREAGQCGRKLSPATIKKELTTLRSLWNWAKNGGLLSRDFPSRGLRYPKMADKPPFQTWSEITRKIAAYHLLPDQQSRLWECLFLTTAEIDELLADLKHKVLPSCIYPMFVFAAHTGARRSEILRCEIDDIDLCGRKLTIREKKRVRGRHTTRSVPISPLLHAVLEEWFVTHPGYGVTFTLGTALSRSKKHRAGSEPLTRDEAHDHFKRALAGTKWAPLRGWHVFRHSFCSNCAATGIDQRIINTWVGHQTEEMVKRYRHLVPNQELEAISKIFPVRQA